MTYEEMKAAFAKRLREARTRAGITQQQLAQDMGISLSTIRNWETGVDLPRFSHYLWLCLRFGWTHQFAAEASHGLEMEPDWPGATFTPLPGAGDGQAKRRPPRAMSYADRAMSYAERPVVVALRQEVSR